MSADDETARDHDGTDAAAPDGVDTGAAAAESTGRSTAIDTAPPNLGNRLLYAVCRFIAVGLSRMLFPGAVVGLENLPTSGAYVIAPLHRSHLDFLIVARITRRRLRYLAKAEVWRFARLGRFIEHLGALPVHRESTDRDSFNRSLAVLVGGEPLMLFPEGTRGHGQEVGELREGAAYLALRAGVPLVPVGLAGTERALSRRHLPHPSRVRIVIGPVVTRPAGSVGSRVPRSLVRSITAELAAAIQSATEDARALLSITTGSGVASRAGAPALQADAAEPSAEQES
jgi:1-acyl-sn-glycerol-3-phosphate acyltransferase